MHKLCKKEGPSLNVIYKLGMSVLVHFVFNSPKPTNVGQFDEKQEAFLSSPVLH